MIIGLRKWVINNVSIEWPKEAR